MATGKKRSGAQLGRDRYLISGLYLQGYLQREIAEQLGLSSGTVSNDLRAIRKIWLESTLINFSEMKARELARINILERTYWEAWERSLGLKERPGQVLGVIKTITHYVGQGEGGDQPAQTRMVVNSAETVGDLACLAGIERCVAMRVRLLGLDEPQLLQVVDDDFDHDKWVAERNERHANALQTLRIAANRGTPPQLEG